MKQLYHTAGHQSFDLTECKIHRIVDADGKARFIVSYPKKWEASEKQPMALARGGEASLRSFNVLEWEEVELEVKS